VLDLKIEKVCSARNAGVVITHCLLAAPLQVVVVEIEPILDDAAQILLDGQLILGSRRHYARTHDRAVGVDLVLV
jgi:hypothetical protein